MSNNYLSRNRMRHAWATKNTNTLTMAELYANFDEFAALYGWEPNEDDFDAYENIWNQIYNLSGDSYLIKNTKDYNTQWIGFVIQDEYEVYKKANELWDSEIERLRGVYSEMNVFNIGDMKEDITNYDKYKNGRSTRETNFDILTRIKELQDMRTPYNHMIRKIMIRIFKSFNDAIIFFEEV